MTRRHHRVRRAAAGAVLLLLAGAQAGVPATWETRLEMLRPEDPLAYFELAEEIADIATGAADVELARRLFALAGVLDREGFGRSACLALADLATLPAERRRLLATASLLGDDGLAASGPLGSPTGLDRPIPDHVMIALTDAFSLYRLGRGTRALAALEDEPAALALLDEAGHFLAGGANRFLEDCRRYRGRLRPGLTDTQLTQMLELEAALLAGDDRAWSSELRLSEGRPLVEVDPERIEETLGIDASHPWYRDGRWVETVAKP